MKSLGPDLHNAINLDAPNMLRKSCIIGHECKGRSENFESANRRPRCMYHCDTSFMTEIKEGTKHVHECGTWLSARLWLSATLCHYGQFQQNNQGNVLICSIIKWSNWKRKWLFSITLNVQACSLPILCHSLLPSSLGLARPIGRTDTTTFFISVNRQ